MSKRILVVDDDKTAAGLMKRLLERCDLIVDTASNGGEALVLVERYKPDLVFLDLMMPEINGWQFLDLKAKIPEFKGIPVVLYSGYQHVDLPISEDANVVGTIQKPADVDEVRRCVEKII